MNTSCLNLSKGKHGQSTGEYSASSTCFTAMSVSPDYELDPAYNILAQKSFGQYFRNWASPNCHVHSSNSLHNILLLAL